MTMFEFLENHPTIRLRIRYNSILKAYMIDVYDENFDHGRRAMRHFALSQELIKDSDLMFDSLIGIELENFWESISR